jgi:hypothetical protein
VGTGDRIVHVLVSQQESYAKCISGTPFSTSGMLKRTQFFSPGRPQLVLYKILALEQMRYVFLLCTTPLETREC